MQAASRVSLRLFRDVAGAMFVPVCCNFLFWAEWLLLFTH